MRWFAAGLRYLRAVWRDEWREAHLTMGTGAWTNHAQFLAVDAPILLLLTPLIFLVGAFAKDVP